jgi:hypothetical protein
MVTNVARLVAVGGLALALGACATTNTPQQNLAYERWARCGGTAFVQLERIDVDGRITFQYADGGSRERVLDCLAAAGRLGPPLPAPQGVRPPGGP